MDSRIPAIPDDMDAIGGYFALDLAAQVEAPPHSLAHSFQSGRAAFLALLETVRPLRVWLPWYLCDSMAEPLRQARVSMQRYSLRPDFSVGPDIDLAEGDLLLCVNYFGLLGRAQEQARLDYPAAQVVFDNSQAFYSPPGSVLASLYSPRKFLGVPDGGYLVAAGLAVRDYPQDTGSWQRSEHLLKRHAFGAESGYAAFGAAEASLSAQSPLRMSALTQRLLAAAAHGPVKQQRRRNFAYLNERLGRFNQLEWALGDDDVPLCYPFLSRLPGLRPALWSARIYAACYWPELLEPGRQLPALERGWANELLALPLDQRYEPETLERHLVIPLLRLLQA